MTGNEPIRRRVLYSGHVQGVGFRATAQFLARDYPVTGFVRNLPDGSVELVVEGQAKDIEGFQRAIARRMQRNINDTATTDQPATGEFSGFTITRG